MKKTYGYARVSTREQHLDRQLKALMDAGVEERDIITDKVSGKDLEREGYRSLKNHFLRDGDTLIVKSLDRLSRRKIDIKKELEYLAVTIDTNIFDAARFDLCDTSTLKILENYVKSGKIRVVLSDIVVRESKRHIADQVKKICGIIENITDSDIEEIQAWANAQYERVSEIADIGTLPDVMSFGETIVIKGVDGSKASLSIGDNQISPDEGSEEVIDICFSNGDENTTSGYIKLTVGYLNFDEDGGAADGLSDDVEYEYDDILKELDSFIDAQKREVKKDTKIAEIISDVINAGIDNT